MASLPSFYHNPKHHRRAKNSGYRADAQLCGGKHCLCKQIAKQAGTIRMGSAVRNSFFTRWGAAIPTKEIGPANATMHADKILENTTIPTRRSWMFTPTFFA